MLTFAIFFKGACPPILLIGQGFNILDTHFLYQSPTKSLAITRSFYSLIVACVVSCFVQLA